jgi:hypothetical protein
LGVHSQPNRQILCLRFGGSDPESFFHYLTAWNEAETSRIRAHLERSVAPEVLFVDPA